MPDSDGAATVAGLHACAADVPLVVLTGSDDDTVTRETFAAGAQDYLVKGGFDAPLLGRTIRHALERHRLAGARARAEKALRESEERYRSLSEASFEGVAIHDDGTIVDANTTTRRCSAMRSVTWSAGTSLSSRPPSHARSWRTCSTARPASPTRRSGCAGTAACSPASCAGDRSSTKGAWRGWCRSGTSPPASASRRSCAAANNGSGRCWRRRRRRWSSPAAAPSSHANPAFCALLDSPDAAALVGRPALGFVAADFRTAVSQQLQSVQSGDRPAPGDQRWTSLAGRSLCVAVSNVPITYEDQPAVLKFAFDVTDRRRAEDAPHEAKDLFESAFSAAPIGMTLIGLTPDTAGRVLQSTPPFASCSATRLTRSPA